MPTGAILANPLDFWKDGLFWKTTVRQGVAAELLRAAEEWAREHGCTEMASDTWIDSDVSQRVHEAMKFEVVARCVHYRKEL